jgi:RHS repeat-associated protein
LNKDEYIYYHPDIENPYITCLKEETTNIRCSYDNISYGLIEKIITPETDEYTYAYDTDLNLDKINLPDNKTRTFTRDDLGNVNSFKDEANAIREYLTDDNGNLIARILPGPDGFRREEYYTYNTRDQLTNMKSGKTEYNLAYDKSGKLNSVTGNNSYSYNAEYEGNYLTSETTDTGTVNYTYTDSGRIESINSDNVTLSYTYDHMGRMQSIDHNGATIQFAYNNTSNRTEINYPNNITKKMEYYKNGQIKEEKILKFSTEIYSCSYEYNNNGYLTLRKEMVKTEDTFEVEVSKFTYNPDGTLHKAYYSDGEIEEFVYDSNGNRTKLLSKAYGRVDFRYDEYNRLSELVTVNEIGYDTGKTRFMYDPEGNVIAKVGKEEAEYAYDEFGNLNEVTRDSESVQLTYSPFGERLSRTVKNEDEERTERFVYAGDNVLIQYIYDKEGNLLKKNSVISGLGVDEIYGVTGKYFVRDYLGNIKAIFDTEGNLLNLRRYRAFGEEIHTSASGYGFTSREYDDIAGLYYFRSRYYDPKLGRFLQKDIYNEAGYLYGNPGVIYNPAQLNPYNYVGNNPVNYIDPYGTDAYVLNEHFKLVADVNHTAILFYDPDKREFYYYSFALEKNKKKEKYKNVKEALDSKELKRYYQMWPIDLTKEQLKKSIKAANELLDNKYKLNKFACDDFVEKVLEAAGFDLKDKITPKGQINYFKEKFPQDKEFFDPQTDLPNLIETENYYNNDYHKEKLKEFKNLINENCK